jgi:hypothetical protein
MKPFLRRLMYPFTRYHSYDGDVGGWSGWYAIGSRCIAFKGNDGRLSFYW